mgnify:CR=1 FL=1
MVNNFEYIKEHMQFLNEKSFYFIQILKRKKENPELKSYSRPIESFYVFSKDQFERMMPHIIEKCEMNRARAYIKMNCLDAESVMLEQIAEISRIIRNENWHEMASSLNSACGMCGKQNGNEKLYLVDLDDIQVGSNEMKDMVNYIDSLKPQKYDENSNLISKVKMTIPTRHGCHLLVTGFDKQTFSQNYPNIDVHDDGITLLYFPQCCD